MPLKKEHLQFLERALLPLHKPRTLGLYHPQLSYCICQFVEKEPETVVPILKGMIRYWAWNNSSKQVLFLNELEEMMELCRGDQINAIQDDLYKLLAACLGSEHFQVAERALYFWNSEHLCVNVLSQARAPVFLPYVFGPLSKNAQGHWNQTVEGLAQSVLKMSVVLVYLLLSCLIDLCRYMEMDINLYDRCSREYSERTRTKEQERAAAADKWAKLEAQAVAKGLTLS